MPIRGFPGMAEAITGAPEITVIRVTTAAMAVTILVRQVIPAADTAVEVTDAAVIDPKA